MKPFQDLFAWVKRNPKLTLMLTAIFLMPAVLIVNYILLIAGVITAEEFATITGALFPFLKTFLIL